MKRRTLLKTKADVNSDYKNWTHIQNGLLHICLFTDLLAGRLIRSFLKLIQLLLSCCNENVTLYELNFFEFFGFLQVIDLHIHLKNLHRSVWANNHVLAVSGIITTMKSLWDLCSAFYIVYYIL